MAAMFYSCKSITSLNCNGWVINEGCNTNKCFYNISACQILSFEGGLIDESIALIQSSRLTMASVDSIIGALSDRNGKTAKTLTLNSTVKNQMTAAQKAQINAKNWTLA